jgi:hypothetical protein
MKPNVKLKSTKFYPANKDAALVALHPDKCGKGIYTLVFDIDGLDFYIDIYEKVLNNPNKGRGHDITRGY